MTMNLVYTNDDLENTYNLYFHEKNVTRKKKLHKKILRIYRWREEHGIRFHFYPGQVLLSAKHLFPPKFDI